MISWSHQEKLGGGSIAAPGGASPSPTASASAASIAFAIRVSSRLFEVKIEVLR